MNYKHIGLSSINGPLVIVEGVTDAGYEELVTIKTDDGQERTGRVVELQGDKAIIQVFEGTRGLSLEGTVTTFSGKPIMMPLSEEILGRVFTGAGDPLDQLGPVYPKEYKDINSAPINPVSRIYPRNYIETGVSAIDAMTTLIRGQKLPIFSGSGMSHDKLAVQIVKQARVSEDDTSDFCVVFAAMGVKSDVADYFRRSFEQSGALSRTTMFLNLSSDPIIERILTPRFALTAAEYLAYECGKQVLVILTDMTSYAEALRELSSSKGEIPGRKGFPGYLYSDLASLYERAGIIKGSEGSVTQIPILTMPNDDITHPVPDLTGYITEGQIVLNRQMNQKGQYPPISPLPSLSRLMKDGIGAKYTREDHQPLANQLFASYSKVIDARSLASVIGEEELSDLDKLYMKFGEAFENRFICQGETKRRSIIDTLDLGWKLLASLPDSCLDRLDSEIIEKYVRGGAKR